MSLTVRDLIALLRALPGDAEVLTWDPEHEQECAIEQVFTNRFGVVLSLDVQPSEAVDGAEVVWTAHDTAAKGLVKAAAQWARAKTEWVG